MLQTAHVLFMEKERDFIFSGNIRLERTNYMRNIDNIAVSGVLLRDCAWAINLWAIFGAILHILRSSIYKATIYRPDQRGEMFNFVQHPLCRTRCLMVYPSAKILGLYLSYFMNVIFRSLRHPLWDLVVWLWLICCTHGAHEFCN